MAFEKLRQKEVDEILSEHELWIKSSHTEGERANFGFTQLRFVKVNGVNLSAASFDPSVLIDVEFKKCCFNNASLAHLRGGEYKVIFIDCEFSKCRTYLADFSYMIFDTCKIKDVNFETALFKRIQIKSSIISNSDFNDREFKSAYLVNNVFNNCVFDKCNFDGAALDNTIFNKCSFIKANFKNVRMINTEFNDCISLTTNNNIYIDSESPIKVNGAKIDNINKLNVDVKKQDVSSTINDILNT